MGTRTRTLVENTLLFLIAIGIFPSLIALSATYSEVYPDLYRWTGPLNPGKLLLPVLFLWFLAYGISTIGSGWSKALLVAWSIGTLSTFWAAYRCDFSPLFIREWVNLSIGLASGYFLSVVSERKQERVFLFWFGVILASVLLSIFFPSLIDWSYENIFGPETRKGDVGEAGEKLLTGIFGRQSLAKLMAWTPWLVLPFFLRLARSQVIPLMGVGLFIGLILATSQRGPTLAAFLAMAAFGVHRIWHARKLKSGAPAFTALIVAVVSLFLFVPTEILRPRVTSAFVEPENPSVTEREHIAAARDNASVRTKMTVASLDVIREFPLGNACLPESFYTERGLFVSHSHSLFLEQFRTRGWLWGFLHLALWLFAGLALWRGSDLRSASYFAGWVAVVVSGFFDHPWFVLNHALILGVYLALGARYFRAREKASNSV